MLLAADAATPERLEQDGLAVEGTRATYAIGKLVLWILPQDLYEPIRQDAVMLERARHQPAARELMNFLQSEEARVITHQ